ncbi:hypothetical protein MBLNU13_g11577t2 [Cladosporium sp. NU13]
MANVQLVRTRQTFATTTINEVQSIQLVQTMLHGAMSTLTYLRELFPEKAFEYRYYEMRETPLPYKDFAAARMPSFKSEADPHSTKLPVLLRKRSKRADLFLDWLEKGVFPELDSGELRAVQLLIHPDKKSRDTVLETYTFTIHYTVSEDGRRTPSGLAASSYGRPAATTKATNIALQQLLRSVDSLCQDLPALPNGRLMSMELIYENDKGKPHVSKSIEGFMPCKGGDDLSFAKAEGWEIRTKSLEFTTDCHDTTLRITGLQNDKTSYTGQTQDVPSNIEFSSNVSRYHDVRLVAPPPVIQPVDKPTRGSTFLSNSESLGQNETAAMRKSDTHDVGRQSSLISSMNGDLEDMMHPERITQGDTQTQGAFRHSVFEDAVTVTPSSLRAPSVQSTILQTPPTTDTFPLLSDTQHHIASRKPYLKRTANALASEAGGRTASGQMVLCQCGCQKDEGGMVQCSYCSTWQHLHCYGYTGNADPRLPGEHRLAVERRAVFHMAESGLRTRTDFAKSLGIPQDRASELHAMMRRNNFVTDAEKSHKPGYRATGKALFVPVQDDATIRKLLEIYFDPMTHISHHYGSRIANETIESEMKTNIRLIRGMAADLPPAATPHRSKKKPFGVIPSGESDLPSTQSTPMPSAPDALPSQAFAATSSMIQQTLMAGNCKRTRQSKRALDTEEAEFSDNKRFATPKTVRRLFTSFRSSALIDANDKSSPYLHN